MSEVPAVIPFLDDCKSVILDSTIGRVTLGVVGTVALLVFIQKRKAAHKREEWRRKSKNVLIFHQFFRGKIAPSASPFCFKLETYLRMADIKYEVDISTPMGPKGKSPWVTVDGKDIGDTQLIIQYLGEKYNKNFHEKAVPIAKATAHAVLVMLEERTFQAVGMERMLNTDMSEIIAMKWYFKMIMPLFKRSFAKRFWTQGIGRHSREEIIDFVKQDFQVVSDLLGTKKFILGDDPSEYDCGIFAILSMAVWIEKNTVLEKMIREEFVNLYNYCFRMKETFYPDWDQLLVVD